MSHNQIGDYNGICEYENDFCEHQEADQFIYIPVEEMLSHSKGLIPMAKKYSKEMPFDKLSLDIIDKAQRWKLDRPPELARSIIPKIEQVINGTVFLKMILFLL